MQTIHLENGSVLELSLENGLVIRGKSTSIYFNPNENKEGKSGSYMIFEDMMKIDFNFAINPDMFTDEEIASYVRSKIVENNLKESKKVKELLDKSVETKTLVTLISNQYRGFGKTYALAKKAEKLGAILVVPRELKSGYLDLLPETQIKCYVSPQQATGIRLPNGFLVDEGVKSEVIKELSKKSEFLGGFNRL